MSGGDHLDFALSSLLFYKFEEKPQPVGVDAVVYLLEEVQPASLGPSSAASMPRKRRVPSDAL